MQKPSVGRIVHVNWHGIRLPCVITRVESDTHVRVFRLDGSGLVTPPIPYAEESEQSAKGVNSMTTPNHSWSWPPRIG